MLNKVQARFESILVSLTGFLFGAVPEVGLFFACFCGAWGILRFPQRFSSRDVFLVLFGVTRLVYALRTGNPIWIAFIEFFAILLLPRAGWILFSQTRRLFGYMTVLGLCIPVGFVVITIFRPDASEWIAESKLAKIEIIDKFQTFIPVDAGNAWVLKPLGVQGPGKVEYIFEVRANEPMQINIGFLHSSLPNGRKDEKCFIKSGWTNCKLVADLSLPDVLTFGFGGYGLWKKGMSNIQVKSHTFKYLTALPIVEQFKFTGRQKSYSFNENAFGAWIVLVGFLALCTMSHTRVIVMVFILILMAILFSGSRGSMLAGLVGVLTYFLAQKRFRRFVPAVIVIGFASVLYMQVDSSLLASNFERMPNVVGFRAFVFDEAGKTSRVDIWQSAFKSFLGGPIVGSQKLVLDSSDTQALVEKVNFPSHTHNVWIQMLYEGGLIQLSILISLFIVVFFKVMRKGNLLWAAPFFVLIVINSTDFLFYYAPVRMAFGLLLAEKSHLAIPTLHMRTKPGLKFPPVS